MPSASESWTKVGIAASASILGSSMIYADSIWNTISSRHISIADSDIFIGVSLSLSCGTLLMTALNALLPRAVSYIIDGHSDISTKQANALLIPFFAIGVIVCQFMNFIVLRFASRSAISCSHDLDRPARVRKRTSDEHTPLLQDEVAVNFSASSAVEDLGAQSQQLLQHQHHHQHLHQHQHHNLADIQHEESHSSHDHETQLEAVKSGSTADLLAISLQTILGICIHRVPEGFLLFTASQIDRQLGASLVLALGIHSFSEGFSVAVPLNAALKRKGLVWIVSAILGCGPQLLGALIGWLLLRGERDLNSEAEFFFGIGMSTTAGFMVVVSLQMVISSLCYMSQAAVVSNVVLGIVLSLLSRAI
nr:Zrt3 [Starmerella bombicola]